MATVQKLHQATIINHPQQEKCMKIGIIGAAGIIGSATAFCIGAKRLVDTIALIDLPGDALNFHTLDLTTGVSGAGINVISGGLELLEDASLVIMTASVPLGKVSSRREMLSANLTLCAEVARAIRRYCPDTILLQVTNPIEPLGYAAFTGLPAQNRQKQSDTPSTTPSASGCFWPTA